MRTPEAHHGRPWIERNCVAVHGDSDVMESVLGLLAVQFGLAQVHENEVDVGAARDHVDACGCCVVGQQSIGQDLRAFEGALLPFPKVLFGSKFEGDGLAGDDVFEGPPC